MPGTRANGVNRSLRSGAAAAGLTVHADHLERTHRGQKQSIDHATPGRQKRPGSDVGWSAGMERCSPCRVSPSATYDPSRLELRPLMRDLILAGLTAPSQPANR